MIATIIIVGYIISAILTYGIIFGHFQGKFPTLAEKDKRTDMGFACWVALWGPIGLIIGFLLSGFAQHGLKFR